MTSPDFLSQDSPQKKPAKTGYPVFNLTCEEQSTNKTDCSELRNICSEGVQHTPLLKIDEFEIYKEGRDYILKTRNLTRRFSRITEVISSHIELYEAVIAVNEIKNKIMEIFLKDPDLFSKIVEFFDIYIAEDIKTRKHILLALFSTFTGAPLNLAVKAPTSEGKTYNVTTIAKFFPRENVLVLGAASPTSLIHDTNSVLVDKNLNPIEDRLIELQETMKKSNNDEKRKLAQERANLLKNARYLVNLRNKALIFLEEPNPEFWKKLRPILSHDMDEIEYRITDKNRSGGFWVKNVVIKGFPSVIYCTTRVDSLSIEDELRSRFLSVTTESTAEKYEKALDLTARKEMFGFVDRSVEESLMREVIEQICKLVSKWHRRVILPCFDKILKKYFSDFKTGVILRKAKEIAQFVKVHTSIHAESRPRMIINGQEFLLATKKDYDFTFNLIEREDMRLEPNLRRFLEEIHDYLENSAYAGVEAIQEHLLERGRILTGEYTRKCLNALVSAGVLEKRKDPEDNRRNVYSLRYPLYQAFQGAKDFYNQLDFENFINTLLSELKNNKYKTDQEEYLQLTLFDPTTGYTATFDDKHVGACVVLLKNLFFKNSVNDPQSENEAVNEEKKPDIRLLPASFKYVNIKIVKLPPVGEIVGVDGEVYHIEREGQVLKIPELNARPFLERGYAIIIKEGGEES